MPQRRQDEIALLLREFHVHAGNGAANTRLRPGSLQADAPMLVREASGQAALRPAEVLRPVPRAAADVTLGVVRLLLAALDGA